MCFNWSRWVRGSGLHGVEWRVRAIGHDFNTAKPTGPNAIDAAATSALATCKPAPARKDETVHPRLTARMEQTHPIPVLLWQFAEPRLCISSGPLGGGIGARDWGVNATVPLDYDRTDPDRHLTEIGNALKLVGTGCGLLTAVDVTRHHLAADSGAHAAATVGLFQPGLGGRARPALPPRVRRTATRGGSAGVIRDRGTGHRNRLGRDRRALPNGRDSGDIRRAALRIRRPDRTSGARGRTCRRPVLDFRAPRAAPRLMKAQTLVGVDGIEPPAAGV